MTKCMLTAAPPPRSILYESALDPDTMMAGLDQLSRGRPRILYIIRNSQVSPNGKTSAPGWYPIAGRAVSTLINTMGWAISSAFTPLPSGIKWTTTWPPSRRMLLLTRGRAPFDQVYMNQLFDWVTTWQSRAIPG